MFSDSEIADSVIWCLSFILEYSQPSKLKMSFQFFSPFPLLLLGFPYSSVGKNLFAM